MTETTTGCTCNFDAGPPYTICCTCQRDHTAAELAVVIRPLFDAAITLIGQAAKILTDHGFGTRIPVPCLAGDHDVLDLDEIRHQLFDAAQVEADALSLIPPF